MELRKAVDIKITDEPVIGPHYLKIDKDFIPPSAPSIEVQILTELRAIRTLLESTVCRPPLLTRIWQRIKKLCGIH